MAEEAPRTKLARTVVAAEALEDAAYAVTPWARRPSKRSRLAPQLIGHGYFGCVFSPPIPCPDGRFAEFDGDATKVSKYGAWADLSNEMFAYGQLNRLDPECRWHMPFYGGCKVPDKDYIKHFASGGCEEASWMQITSGPRGLIYMDRATSSLTDTLTGKAQLPHNADLARSAENVVRGLMAMADNGIVYGDLTSDNLVFGPDGMLRIIDFNNVEYTNPEKAHLLLFSDLERVQEVANELLEAFPERERDRPEEFMLLREFVKARLWYAGKPLVTRDFSIRDLPEDPHPRMVSEGKGVSDLDTAQD